MTKLLKFILNTSHFIYFQASEAFDSAISRLQDSKVDFDTARKNSREAANTFQKIKESRAERFNEAFKHIDQALKTIYTDMTKSRCVF